MALRNLLASLVLFFLLGTGGVSAADYDRPPQQNEAAWGKPNVAPLKAGPRAAMALLNGDGLVPADIAAKLVAKAESGKSDWAEKLPQNYRITRMGFTLAGKHVVLRNVVVVTSEWPSGVSQVADFYAEEGAGGMLYLFIRPHACGNWSIRIVTLQGVCIPDPIPCDADCVRLRSQL